jgi:hypothetical protein
MRERAVRSVRSKGGSQVESEARVAAVPLSHVGSRRALRPEEREGGRERKGREERVHYQERRQKRQRTDLICEEGGREGGRLGKQRASHLSCAEAMKEGITVLTSEMRETERSV